MVIHSTFVQGESDYRYAAKDIKEGLQHMMPAARTRANAVYYGFIVLSLGLIVTVRPRSFRQFTSDAIIRCPKAGLTRRAMLYSSHSPACTRNDVSDLVWAASAIKQWKSQEHAWRTFERQARGSAV